MDIIKAIKKHHHKEKAKQSQVFFDKKDTNYFLGIYVPVLRKIAKEYKDASLDDLKTLLQSKYHEHKSLALFILESQFSKGMDIKYLNFYLKNIKYINNWAQVDQSASFILGKYLFNNKSKIPILSKLAKSNNRWERRIAMVATKYFINNLQFKEPIKIAKILLNDKEDIIQKAVGWMLKEIGNRDKQELVKFLDKNHTKMSNVEKRYAMEKFTKQEKDKYKIKKV